MQDSYTAGIQEEIFKRENGLLQDDDDSREIINEKDMAPLVEAEKSERFLSEKQLRFHINAIRDTIRAEEKKLRSDYPILAWQNLIGSIIFLGSWIACFVNATLYLKGYYSFWLAIPLMAISISFLHELEHDLIHNMYFKGYEFVQHFMFATMWIAKLSVNPWYRKILHLRHHILSGQTEDLEERFIGLGHSFGWMRWLVCSYPFSNILLFPRLKKDNPRVFGFDMWAIAVLINTPGVILNTVLTHLFIAYTRINLGLTFGAWDPVINHPMWLWPYVQTICILFIFPNVLRQVSLNLMASYCHYYGDIPKHNVYYQNQVLNHWTLYPLQMFCFNFGETHIIHHFVTNQPFYLRQMLANEAVKQLVKHGVRENDFDIVRRNNRYFTNEEEIKKGA